MVVIDMLRDEINRHRRLEKICLQKIASFPNGKLYVYRNYHYLKYTRNGHSVSKYIKKSDVDIISSQIRERDDIYRVLQRTRQDIQAMENVLTNKSSRVKLALDSPFRDLVQYNINLLLRENEKDRLEISGIPEGTIYRQNGYVYLRLKKAAISRKKCIYIGKDMSEKAQSICQVYEERAIISQRIKERAMDISVLRRLL